MAKKHIRVMYLVVNIFQKIILYFSVHILNVQYHFVILFFPFSEPFAFFLQLSITALFNRVSTSIQSAV